MKQLAIFVLTVITYQSIFAQPAHKKWTLVWGDEFNYTGLPDSTKWGYDVGFIRNNESEYYTKGRLENARVADGMLTITGRKETYPNKMYKPGSTEWQHKDSLSAYTSAAIVTLNKKHFTYGRLEVRATIPQGLGVWPAIWMLGVDRGLVRWPYCGEIDVMEFVGHDSSRIYGTLHYADTIKHEHAQNGGHIETAAPYNGFHIYAMEWNEKEINLFFDDSLYHHFDTEIAGKGKDNPFRKPFYLLLNLALGGSWGGHINDAVLPAKYEVDYVRMYQ